MRGRGLDPVPVTFRDIAELVTDNGLRRASPGLDWVSIQSGHCYGWMQIQVAPEMCRSYARTHQERGGLQRSGREHYSARDDLHGACVSIGISNDSFHTRRSTVALHQPASREWRYDPRARTNRVKNVGVDRALLSPNPAA